MLYDITYGILVNKQARQVFYMFPKFPEFTPLLPIHKEAYNAFMQKFPPHSDLSFGTLMIWWNLTDDLRITSLNDNLVLSYNNPFLNNKICYTLLGTSKVDESMETLFALQRAHGLTPELYLVPDYTINALHTPGHFLIEEDPDNADYVVSTQLLAELTDSSVARTRRKVRQFLREAGESVEVQPIIIDGIAAKIRLINAIHQWDNAYSRLNDREHHEGVAINKALLLSELNDMQCLAVLVEGVIEGFVLYQYPPQNDFVIANHLKVSYRFPHTFDFVLHELSKRLTQEQIPYLNIEQDLGLPGLRFHKEQLRPVLRLRKYMVRPTTQPTEATPLQPEELPSLL